MNVDIFLSRLDKVKETGRGTWIACCPAHQDRNPSMAIRETDDGKILVHCFAGCDIESILGSVGLTIGDLFPSGPLANHSGPTKAPRLPARDVLECVAKEALIVAITAAAIADGTTVLVEDLDRCRLANLRLHEAINAID